MTLPKDLGRNAHGPRRRKRTPEASEGVLRDLERSVIACVQRQRWTELRASVTEHGQAWQIDPGDLLIWLLFQDLTRRLLAMPDSDAARRVPDAMVGFAMVIDPMTLDEMIDLLIDVQRYAPAFQVFEALHFSGPGESAH